MSTPQDQERDITFEEAYRELEKIVANLESGRGDLEDSLESYERGVRLVRICRDKLAGAARRIELLKGIDENGDVKVEAVDEAALLAETEGAGRQRRANAKSAPEKAPSPSGESRSFVKRASDSNGDARRRAPSQGRFGDFDFDSVPPF